MEMIINKKYALPHGTGVFVGYEEFYDNGEKSRIVDFIASDNARRVFKLDEGHTWPFDLEYYAVWDREIREIN